MYSKEKQLLAYNSLNSRHHHTISKIILKDDLDVVIQHPCLYGPPCKCTIEKYVCDNLEFQRDFTYLCMFLIFSIMKIHLMEADLWIKVQIHIFIDSWFPSLGNSLDSLECIKCILRFLI